MNLAVAENVVGEEKRETAILRLNREGASPLPEFEGKITRLVSGQDGIYCEYKVTDTVTSVLKLSFGAEGLSFPVAMDEAKLAALIMRNSKTYIGFQDKHGHEQVMAANEIAQLVNLPLSVLRESFPAQYKDKQTLLCVDAGKNKFLTRDIPIPCTLADSLAGSPLIFSSRGEIGSPAGIDANLQGKMPRLENGILMFPAATPPRQLVCKAAVQHGPDIIYSLDSDGMLYEIREFTQTSPKIRELGKLPLDLEKGATIGGVSTVVAGNQLYVSVEQDSKSRLEVFDLKSLTSLATVDGVQGALACDPSGNVFYVDSNSTLRVVSSNYSALSDKRIVEPTSRILEAAGAVESILDSVSLPAAAEREVRDGLDPEERSRISAIQEKLLSRIAPEIAKCESLKQLFDLKERIDPWRNRVEFTELPESFALVDLHLTEKEDALAYPELEKRLASIESGLKRENGEMVSLREDMSALASLREKVTLLDADRRLEIGDRIEACKKNLEARSGAIDQQLSDHTTQLMQKFEKMLASCVSENEVTAAVFKSTGKAIGDAISQVHDSKTSKSLQLAFDTIIDNRIDQIVAARQQEALKKSEQTLRAREAVTKVMDRFRRSLESVIDPEQIKQQVSSPLVAAVRNQINSLPESERADAVKQLDRLIAEKARAANFSAKIANLAGTSGSVRFGSVEFPKAGSYELLFKPRYVPLRDRPEYSQLVWTDARGREFEPETAPVETNAVAAEGESQIRSTREEAQKFFQSISPTPPKVRSTWVLNKPFEDYLEKFCTLFNYQLKLGQGIMIAEGDAGTAKSALIQMFCALTERPISTFACNGKTEKDDLTYLYQYDPEKGTYRLDSGFIQALQTPNAVVVLEEINSLPVTVAKMLNTLLDFRREIYLPDGRTIKADPSVLLVGLQNPQSYAGVSKLSKEFLSRALVVEVDYIQEKDGQRWLPYEAEMYARYRPALDKLNQEQFYAVWDKIVNGRESDLANALVTPEITAEVNGLKRLVAIANSARRSYRAYQREESAEPFDFIFSYREAEAIASLWDGKSRIEKLVAEIVLPKISDTIEKKAMEALLKTP